MRIRQGIKRERRIIEVVAQTSSPRGLRSKAGGQTEAFTAENAENSMETLMLYLSDLCAPGRCSKFLSRYYTPRNGKMLETRSQA